MGLVALTRELALLRALVDSGPVRLWATPLAEPLVAGTHPLGLVALALDALRKASYDLDASSAPVSLPLGGPHPGVCFAGARLAPSDPYLLVLHADAGEQTDWPLLFREGFAEVHPPAP